MPRSGLGEENERPLSAAGRDAARRLAAELADAGIAAVYSSPYPRAVQTVEPLATALGLDTALDEIAARHHGETVAVASHGNLIALALAANDPAVGFDFWRSMPMPAVYRLERE